MKFLLDVNASGSVKAWLVAQTYDVVLVEDVDPRMDDGDVLAWALREI
jgi:hypothetical protein